MPLGFVRRQIGRLAAIKFGPSAICHGHRDVNRVQLNNIILLYCCTRRRGCVRVVFSAYVFIYTERRYNTPI